MFYVVMVLHGPLQSWGAVNLPEVNSQSPRKTYTVPTKSALIGLIRSGLGQNRDDDSSENLKNSRILTRIDRPGTIRKDYQISQRTHHGFNAGTTKETPKMFLQDATFTVLFGLDSKNEAQEVALALTQPQWAPFLGRRAHVPTLPIYLGIVETDNPREFLQKDLPVFWGNEEQGIRDEKMVTIMDSEPEETFERRELMVDEPYKFNPKFKQYGERYMYVVNALVKKPETIGSAITQYQKLREEVSQ